MTALRFQADNDLNEDIVSGIRRRNPAIDFATATEGGIADLHDETVLAIAARDGRVLVSHDLHTMGRAFAVFTVDQNSAGCIIVLQSHGVRSAINGLIDIWKRERGEDWIDRIMVLPRRSEKLDDG